MLSDCHIALLMVRCCLMLYQLSHQALWANKAATSTHSGFKYVTWDITRLSIQFARAYIDKSCNAPKEENENKSLDKIGNCKQYHEHYLVVNDGTFPVTQFVESIQ